MKKSNIFLVFTLLLIFVFQFSSVQSQNAGRFEKQIKELVEKEYNFDPGKKLVVFAGSSSVRMWTDVQDYFPGYNVINNGFGGSHFSDLHFYYKDVILKPAPDILFIYEGDNDIASKKDPKVVSRQAKQLGKMVRKDLPDTKIIFISAKPSIRRAEYDPQYKKLNKRIKRFTCLRKNLYYADVWSAMMENGSVKKDIFKSDNLHMNEKGYEIWGEVVKKYLP